MYNNYNGQNLEGNYRRNNMSYEFLGRSNPRQHDMRNFMSIGFGNTRFMRNSSQRRGCTTSRACDLFPNIRDASVSLEYPNLENSDNTYSNQNHGVSNRTENRVANSMYFYPNSTTNINDPVNQSPDISSSTSPKKELNPNNETHSDIKDQNINSNEPITSSLQNAEKNNCYLSKSETHQCTQLDTNPWENLVSIT